MSSGISLPEQYRQRIANPLQTTCPSQIYTKIFLDVKACAPPAERAARSPRAQALRADEQRYSR